ncbi:hypothetical protein TNCV_3493181 [Trichonephila clavipes]|nr:hypothetical protein TNCV_3493181 [Trichonephila clavipes]
MPLRHRRSQFHQLITGELDHITELNELGLSLLKVATRVGHNMSTIQRWIQEGLRACRRGSGVHRPAYSPVDYSRPFLHGTAHLKPAASRRRWICAYPNHTQQIA